MAIFLISETDVVPVRRIRTFHKNTCIKVKVCRCTPNYVIAVLLRKAASNKTINRNNFSLLGLHSVLNIWKLFQNEEVIS